MRNFPVGSYHNGGWPSYWERSDQPQKVVAPSASHLGIWESTDLGLGKLKSLPLTDFSPNVAFPTAFP